MPPLSSRLIHDIRSSHLKQLAQLQPPPPNDPKKAPTDEPDSTLLTKVLEAIKANPEAIKAAQDTREILLYRLRSPLLPYSLPP